MLSVACRFLRKHQRTCVLSAQFGRGLAAVRVCARARRYSNMMKWNNQMALQLIDEYEKYPLLWDAKHEDHFSRKKKTDAWNKIALNFDVDIFEVKQKMNSLLGSFRREKAKRKKEIGTTGNGRHDIYVSKWFAFDRMGYLLGNNELRTTMKTDKTEGEDTDDDMDTLNNISSDGESVGIQSATATQPTPVSPKKKQKKHIPHPRTEEAYQIMNESLHTNPPDYFTVYAQHIANKLRSYSKTTQIEVEHAVNNILYNADKGDYDRPASQHSD